MLLGRGGSLSKLPPLLFFGHPHVYFFVKICSLFCKHFANRLLTGLRFHAMLPVVRWWSLSRDKAKSACVLTNRFERGSPIPNYAGQDLLGSCPFCALPTEKAVLSIMMDVSLSYFFQELTSNPVLLITVALTLGVIFVNGWTDAPNAIAGVVATGSMPYRAAAWMAAACNLAGALFFCLMGGQVAKTSLNLTDFSQSGEAGFCALAGCFLSVVLLAAAAWYWGIPTSESHGLMAGMLGSGLALGTGGAVHWQDWQPVLAGLFLSLGLGFLLGLILYRLA